MNRLQSGFVLVTTMMMLAVLTLLILSVMQGGLLYIKSGNQIVMNHRLFYQMERIANRLDLTTTHCMVQGKNPNQLIQMLLNHQGCIHADGSHRFAYVIEDLGLFPCLQVMVDEAGQGSHHWLVTIVALEPPQMVLQMRIAKPEATLICSLLPVNQISSGIVSWRKLGNAPTKKHPSP